MGIVRWLVGGAVGAAIGVAIWVVVGYFAQYEVGYIAWGIGFLVGLGVRFGARDTFGVAPGAVAVSMAIGAVLLGKYLVAGLLVNAVFADSRDYHITDPDVMIGALADDVAEESEKAGHPVQWPEVDEGEDVPIEAGYPPHIWTEAKNRWNELPPEQQQARTAEHEQAVRETLRSIEREVRAEAFAGSFGPLDLLWFGLAAITAFKVGAGVTSDS